MIYLNGTPFDVEVRNLSRDYIRTKAYRVQTEDGLQHTKTLAIKRKINVTFMTLEPDDHNAILDILTSSSSEYITIKIEDEINGNLEFTAILGDVSDESVFIDGKEIWWGALSTVFEER